MNGPTSPTAPVRAEVPESEFKALVTIEVAERLAIEAHHAIAEGDLNEAVRLLDALTTHTTIRTCTAVKNQPLSDAISHQARTTVAQVKANREKQDTARAAASAAYRSLANPDNVQQGFIGRPDRPGGV